MNIYNFIPYGFISILSLLFYFIDRKFKKYKIIIFSIEADNIIHTYNSIVIPDVDNVLILKYNKDAYLVRKRIIKINEDIILLHVTDIYIPKQ